MILNAPIIVKEPLWQIASNWGDLWDGVIDKTLTNAWMYISAGGWWSGTNSDGSVLSAYNCSGFDTTAGNGYRGNSWQTTSAWVIQNNVACTTSFSVLCACSYN